MSTGTRATDELADLVRPAVRAVARAAPRIVLAVAVVLTSMAGFALVGAAVDDHTISADQGVARAEVLDGSTFFRTLVRFPTADGQAHTPEQGVFYPRGVAAGSTVTVEYAVGDPDLVRVAGRGWWVGLVPLGVAVAVVWLVAVPWARWLRRRRAG